MLEAFIVIHITIYMIWAHTERLGKLTQRLASYQVLDIAIIKIFLLL